MAVSDSAVLIIYCIQLSLKFFESFHIIGKYVAACRIWMFLMTSVNLLSPWLVVGLTVDRFYCVVFPLTRDRFCTRRKAKIVCSCLATLSVLLNLPLLEGVKTVKKSDTCFVENHIVIYVAFMRLVITSNLPCLLILVLNIVIGIHIQRSAAFRKRFTSTSSGSRDNKLDKSLLPLILISMLAFLTTLPSSIVDTVVGVLIVTKSDLNSLVAVAKFVQPFNFLYMINFGQNFYILMASSANYRNVIKRKLNYYKSMYLQEEDANQLRVPVQIPNTDDTRPSVTELNTRSFSRTDSTLVATSDAGGGFRNVSE
ncbi:uncharacterized protein LOC121373146 [Gigantopelta aegis]|uniref:uncharacterized protein LOC121373146 n=1 Tax=Gigantopelta aegis TaxID=1735272 RepID=UPI001B88A794|nr:uncharacterized protein LOC121373146 [Gigantopelta aegis]